MSHEANAYAYAAIFIREGLEHRVGISQGTQDAIQGLAERLREAVNNPDARIATPRSGEAGNIAGALYRAIETARDGVLYVPNTPLGVLIESLNTALEEYRPALVEAGILEPEPMDRPGFLEEDEVQE